MRKVIVAVNKMDSTPDRPWSEERYRAIEASTRALLEQQLSYAAEDIIVVPVSGLTGDNLTTAATVEGAEWYQGPCLLDLLNHIEPTYSNSNNNTVVQSFRGVIDSVISDTTGKTVDLSVIILRGKVCTGRHVGLPCESTTAVGRVRKIVSNRSGAVVDQAAAGERVTMTLALDERYATIYFCI